MPGASKDEEQLERITGGIGKWYSHSDNWQFVIKLNMYLYNNFQLLDLYLWENKWKVFTQ